MTIKIGLLSDVHATPGPVLEALELFRQDGVETILCPGDIAGYGAELEQTVELLIEHGCRTVLGNHDLWFFERRDAEAEGLVADYLRTLPLSVNLTLAGKVITMVHASPPDSLLHGIKLLDEEGEVIPEQKKMWRHVLAGVGGDVLVVGHTHQVFAEQIGGMLVINPGSTLFNHTCAILSLPELTVEFLPLGGRAPVMSWNFGMLRKP